MYLLLLLVNFLIFCRSEEIENDKTSRNPPKVGIIGAGIGGASAGYFMSRQIPGAEITVFEKGEIGGRLATVEVEGRRYETGGSIIHSANQYMEEYLDVCGLKKKAPTPDEPFTLHKNGKIVFQEWGYSLLDKMRMVWRYGVGSLLKLDNFVANLLKNFGTIYHKLDSGAGFDTVAELLDGMSPVSRNGERSNEMMDLTRITLKNKLTSMGLDYLLVEELVTVATRVNYGQMPNSLHAFVGAVGLAGVDGDLWAVEGGNVRVVHCALDISKAKVVKGEVREIEAASDGTFQLKYYADNSDRKLINEQFDLVVIASPLTSDKSLISISPPTQVFPGSYHTTVATIVRGELKPQGIGYGDNSSTLTNFYISPTSTLVSIAKLTPVDYNPSKDKSLPPVFKVFSTRELTSLELSTMFSSVHSINVFNWLAYPSYSIKDDLSSFQLMPGLYYTNRVEWAASAMEMSVIGAKNVANLAAIYWDGEVGEHLVKMDTEVIKGDTKLEL